MKDLGLSISLSGFISIDDLRVPAVKKDILKSTETDVANLNKRLDSNKITEEEFQYEVTKFGGEHLEIFLIVWKMNLVN